MKISPAVAILLVGVAGIGAYLIVRPKAATASASTSSSKSSSGGGSSTFSTVVSGLASIANTAISGYFGANKTNDGNSTEA